jgi:hypothetical protein
LHLLATYPDRAELFLDYPDLEEEDLKQALAFAAANLDDHIEIYPSKPNRPSPTGTIPSSSPASF